MKIAVAGAGYVGLPLAAILAKKHLVDLTDIDSDKIDCVNMRRSPFGDPLLENYLKEQQLNLRATTNSESAFRDSKYVIVATPTDFDVACGQFNTESVENVIGQVLAVNPSATVIIKSTVPVGFTESIRKRMDSVNILFSPEFLREGFALHDSLYPSRIIIGERSARAMSVGTLFRQGSMNPDTPVLLTTSSEAEAIKLFSNAFLAMRVSFFNELDTFAVANSLETQRLVQGVCLDARIGSHYNNPSFGFGGYCLPKDTKQLISSFGDAPQALFSAIDDSNGLRKEFIVSEILARKPEVVGVYRLSMKTGSDNFRNSSTQDVVNKLIQQGLKVVVFEPFLRDEQRFDFELVNDIEEFKRRADLIVANRVDDQISDVINKVYSRDVFGKDT